MVDDLTARRWSKNTKPDAHKPADALRMMLADIEAGKISPEHIIVVYTDNKEGEGKTGFYQAGNIGGYFGAMGLLSRALQIMAET